MLQNLALVDKAAVAAGDAQYGAHRVLSGQLHQEAAIPAGEQVVQGEGIVEGEAQAVAKGHLHDGFRRAAHAGSVGGHRRAAVKKLFDLTKQGNQGLGLRQAVFVVLGAQQAHGMAGSLEFGADNLVCLSGGDGKGNQGGGHVQVFKAAGHGVLAADGANTQIQLGLECAQQSCQGHAPALGVLAHPGEVLLEGQVHIPEGCAGGNELGDGLHHGKIGTMVGRMVGNKGVIAVGHERAVVGMPFLHGNLLDHGLDGGQLIFAAEGHEHGARADGGVEPLGKAPLGAGVEVGSNAQEILPEISGNLLTGRLRRSGSGAGVLGGTVGVQELPADVADGVSVPAHGEPGRLGDNSDLGGAEVFCGGQLQEPGGVLGLHYHSHPLLGFGDGKLGAVQALVFLGHRIQVNVQAVGQLTDSNGHAAGTEVVAALNEPGGLRVPEQPLKLPFLGGVAFLNLRAAGLQGVEVVALGGTGSAAAAVTAGGAAQQDHNVPGHGALPADIGGGSGGNDRADLHPLGSVAGMVNFIHNAGGKADLVAVGGIAGCSGGDQLPLGQLAGNGLGDGLQGVRRAGDTHGTVDIGAAGQGIPDGAADAGSSTAEGFNFCGMVVGFILEQQQPGLSLPVHCHIHFHGAGVDLLGLVQLGKLSGGFQILGGDGGKIHEADGLLLPVKLLSHRQVLVIGLLQQRIGKGHAVNHRTEGGVAAVVGPVGVDHPDLGNGGVPVLAAEIFLAESDVIQVHGKAVFGNEVRQFLPGKSGKALQGGNGSGNGILGSQCLRLFQRGLPGLHRVNDIFLYRGQFPVRDVAVQGVHLGGAHRGPLSLGEDLDALGGRVRPLVKLAGQVFHGKDGGGPGEIGFLSGGVHLGLRKYRGDGGIKQFPGNALGIVPVQNANLL